MTNNENLSVIRTHLENQSTAYLVELLIDLIQAVDEPLRQRYWDRLAPPTVATADLRYSSPEVFITELQEFMEAVAEGEFFDEEALEYFGQDPYDREYYRDKYGDYEDYDPDMHTGLNALGKFLTEANSYFQVGHYEVAADAYEIIIGIVDRSPDDTLGIYDPLAELEETEESLAQHYFIALKESKPTSEFYDQAILYLAKHDAPYRKHMDNFIALVAGNGQADIQTFLEQWADELAQKQIQPNPIGIPYQLRLLMRFYTEANRQDKVMALQERFRHIYLALYDPLLDERFAIKDWSMVISYGQELLALLPQEPSQRPFMHGYAGVDINKVRTQMAHAYEAFGDPHNALEIYQPVYDQQQIFVHYALLRRLTTTIDPKQGKAFTTAVISELQSQLPGSLYFLCQVYLSDNRFDEAYTLAKKEVRYHRLETIKLVAKAHLLAGLGSNVTPEMGAYLQDLYAKVALAGKEATLFLRDHLPTQLDVDQKTAVAHAEALYQKIMQLHINNGRKTYSTAAYYCALLGDIANYDGRTVEFKQFYQELLNRYPRHRALRRELAAKVE